MAAARLRSAIGSVMVPNMRACPASGAALRSATSNGRSPGPFQRSTGTACTVASAPGSRVALRAAVAESTGATTASRRGLVPPHLVRPSRQPEASHAAATHSGGDTQPCPAHGAPPAPAATSSAGRVNAPRLGIERDVALAAVGPLRVRRPDFRDGGGAGVAGEAVLPELQIVRDRRRAAVRCHRRQLRPDRRGPRQRGVRPGRAAARAVAQRTPGVRIRVGNRELP